MLYPIIRPGNAAQSDHSEYNWTNGDVAFGKKEVKVRDKHKASRRKNAPKIIIE